MFGKGGKIRVTDEDRKRYNCKLTNGRHTKANADATDNWQWNLCKERPTLTWRFANHWYLVIYDHIKNQVVYAKQDSPMLNKIVSKLPQS